MYVFFVSGKYSWIIVLNIGLFHYFVSNLSVTPIIHTLDLWSYLLLFWFLLYFLLFFCLFLCLSWMPFIIVTFSWTNCSLIVISKMILPFSSFSFLIFIHLCFEFLSEAIFFTSILPNACLRIFGVLTFSSALLLFWEGEYSSAKSYWFLCSNFFLQSLCIDIVVFILHFELFYFPGPAITQVDRSKEVKVEVVCEIS